MTTAPASLRHEPGLDGLRALAVGLVLLTHAGFGWAPGGFVGVSLFFTLSGYLITTLLLRPSPSRRELGRFWVRRFRRLLPGLAVTIAGVLVLAMVVDLGPPLSQIRGDAWASLLYVANWHFLTTGQTYDALFSAPTPLNHLWSLAIEEQFYLVFPLLVLGLRRVGVTGRRLGLVFFGLWVAGTVANLMIGEAHGVDTVYFATPARAPELLSGAVLAALWPGLLDARPRRLTGRARHFVAIGAVAGLATTLLVFATVADTDASIAGGLLPAISVSSALVVAGVLTSSSLARAFSTPPLVALGRISYGVYLFHWPIFVWLTPVRTGLDPVPLFVLRVTLTLAVATVSHRFVEDPIRRGRSRGWTRARMAPAVLAPAVVIALLAVPVADALTETEALEAELDLLLDEQSSAARRGLPRTERVGIDGSSSPNQLVAEFTLNDSDPPPVAVPEPLVIGVYGDSTAFFTQTGLARWASHHPTELAVVPGSTKIGCPLGRGGRRDLQHRETAPAAKCDWTESWPRLTTETRPHLAVVQVGPWEVADYRPGSGAEWTRVGDPAHDSYLRGELDAAADALLTGAVGVVWLTSPVIEAGWLDPHRRESAIRASDPARMHAFNRLLAEHAAAREGVVIVDLAGHLAELSGGPVDPAMRPDGMHFSGDTAEAVAGWLVPRFVASWNAILAEGGAR